MNSVYPRFKTLLKDPTNFSPSEEAQLFGPTFTSALLQAADEDAKLQKVASVGRISGGFSQKTQQKQADKPEDPRPETSRQGDPSERRGYQTRYTDCFSFFFPVVTTPTCGGTASALVRKNIGARLRFSTVAWRALTKDPWIRGIIESGSKIFFESKPFQSTDQGNSL